MTYRHWGFKSSSGIGPYLYLERGGFLLHLWLRWFRLPWQHGLGWGCTLWLGEHHWMRSR